MLILGIFPRARYTSNVAYDSRRASRWWWLAPIIAGATVGCGAPPPCHCTCETCYSGHVQPPATAEPALASVDAQSSTVDAGAAVHPSPRSKRGSRAGETLTEAQLLARYEGKRAVETLTGKATYYANSLAGRKTASGEPYEPTVFSAAHRTLPFGTVVRVVRTDTNKYVYVRITDRGPFAGGGRIIDLSYVAAQRLGMIRAGVVPVRVEVLR